MSTNTAAAWVHADEAKAGKALSVPLNADALDVLRAQVVKINDLRARKPRKAG